MFLSSRRAIPFAFTYALKNRTPKNGCRLLKALSSPANTAAHVKRLPYARRVLVLASKEFFPCTRPSWTTSIWLREVAFDAPSFITFVGCAAKRRAFASETLAGSKVVSPRLQPPERNKVVTPAAGRRKFLRFH